MNPHVHSALQRAISRCFKPAVAEVRSAGHKRWASATFSGARHHYTVCLSGEAANDVADKATAALIREDFAIAGHIVADLAVTGRRAGQSGTVEIELEALTVEAA